MAYLETDNDNSLHFVLTNRGKEEGLSKGFLNIFTHFTVGDSQVNYTLDSSPNDLLDMNGLHQTSTNRHGCQTNNINK